MPFSLWAGAMVFALLSLLSYMNSKTANYGLDEVLRAVSFSLIFIWAFRRGTSGNFFSKFIQTSVICLLVSGLIGLLVYIFQPVNRFTGTFFDYRFHTDYWPNAWADLLLVSWPLALIWVQKANRISDSLIRHAVLGLFAGFLFLSYSRGAIIAFAGQTVLLIIFTLLNGRNELRARIKEYSFNFSIVVLTALVIFTGANLLRSRFFPVQSLMDKVTFSADEGASSASERAQFWNQSLKLSLDHPLTGWGPYSFRFIQPSLQTSVRATSDHPHNVFLKTALESGWIAALVLAVLIASILAKSSLASVRISKSNSALLMAVAALGIIAHSMIDYNLQFVSVGLIFWLVLGFLASELNWKRSIILNKKLVLSLELTLAIFVLSLAIIETPAILITSAGRRNEALGRSERALDWYSNALSQRFSRDLHLSRAKLLYDLKRYDEAKNAVDNYIYVNEFDYRAYALLGDILRSKRSVDEALAAYDTALMKGGKFNDFGITKSKIKLLIASGRIDELNQVNDSAIELMKVFADAIQNNTHFVALSDNPQEVVALAETFSQMADWKAKPLFEVIAARADYHSQMERAKVKSRPAGYLW